MTPQLGLVGLAEGLSPANRKLGAAIDALNRLATPEAKLEFCRTRLTEVGGTIDWPIVWRDLERFYAARVARRERQR